MKNSSLALPLYHEKENCDEDVGRCAGDLTVLSFIASGTFLLLKKTTKQPGSLLRLLLVTQYSSGNGNESEQITKHR